MGGINMTNKLFFAMSITILLCSCTCSKQVEYRDPLWSFNIYDKNDFNNNNKFHHFDEYPVYKNTVIVSGNKNDIPIFFNINTDNGKKKWEVSHLINNSPISLMESPCVKDGYWYFTDWDKIYRINIATGEKSFINNLKDESNGLGINDMISYGSYLFKWSTGKIFYTTTFEENTLKEIPEVNHQIKHTYINNTNIYHVQFIPKPFLNNNGDMCLLIQFIDTHPDDRNMDVDKISLYNITKKKYVYNGLEVFKQQVSNNFNMSSDSLYILYSLNNFDFTHKTKIFGINVNTGELIWQKELQVGALHNVIDDKIFYITITSPIKLFIYNKQDGKLLKEVASGSNASSNMVLHNGVIYYVEEGTRLRAIDAETGESLLKMETTPDGKPFHLWASSIAVVNGKIILDNYKNVYAYPTIR